jgi:hypothetical protein
MVQNRSGALSGAPASGLRSAGWLNAPEDALADPPRQDGLKSICQILTPIVDRVLALEFEHRGRS